MAWIIDGLKECGWLILLLASCVFVVIFIFILTAILFYLLGWVNYPMGVGYPYTKISDMLIFDFIAIAVIGFIYWLDKRVG